MGSLGRLFESSLGKVVFLKNPAHKNCTRIAAGASLRGGEGHLIWGDVGICPHL